MNTITIELCAEDRARLDAIITGLAQTNHHNCAGCVQAAVTTAVAIAKDPDNVDPAYTEEAPRPLDTNVVMEHPADASTAHLEPVAVEAPVQEGPKAEKPIAFEKFQASVAAFISKGGDKSALKAYLTEKYGKGQVSAVPEDKRAEVLKHLETLLKTG